MHDLQEREGLGPFCEGADAAVDVGGADEGDEDDDAGEDGEPEDGAGEVVEDEVLGLLAAVGGGAGVHWEKRIGAMGGRGVDRGLGAGMYVAVLLCLRVVLPDAGCARLIKLEEYSRAATDKTQRGSST